MAIQIPTISARKDPWGTDSCLACTPSPRCAPQPGPLAALAIMPIRFFQQVISPVDGPRSHYVPSSSQYTLLAMKRYGFIWGFLMGCDRLMRENKDPWVYRTTFIDGCWIKEDVP